MRAHDPAIASADGVRAGHAGHEGGMLSRESEGASRPRDENQPRPLMDLTRLNY
jgi:hypothetical protein